MGKLHLTNVSILHETICPFKFESKDIVCGGWDAGGAEQHMSKVIPFPVCAYAAIHHKGRWQMKD